eukprot:gene3059-3827_t
MDGEQCNIDGSSCGTGTTCSEDGRCYLNNGCNKDSDCPFGSFCDFKQSCTPVGDSGSQCSQHNQCSIRHLCINNKCVEKYSLEIGQPCPHPELCNLFDGQQCDKVDKICKQNQFYGSKCYVDSECGAGKCLCGAGGEDICVGYNTSIVNSICKTQLKDFVECMKREQCSRPSPVTCSNCFRLWQCFEIGCFGVNNFDTHKSNYFKSLKCPTTGETNNNNAHPIEGENNNHNNNNNNNGEIQETENNSIKLVSNIFISMILFSLILLF